MDIVRLSLIEDLIWERVSGEKKICDQTPNHTLFLVDNNLDVE